MPAADALLAAHADAGLVHARDADGYTPLHRAAYNNRVAMVQWLLERGADVGARTLDGWTALHSAARWGQARTAALLLQAGADVNAATTGAQTPLHLAAAQVPGAVSAPTRVVPA